MVVWNEEHTINSLCQYCYCGKDRSLLESTLQCRECRNWFHSECTSVTSPPDLPFTTNYVFECAECGKNREEFFERTTAAWKDICSTAIANLILEDIVGRFGTENRELFESKNAALMAQWRPELCYFTKKHQIIPFVDKHWESICTGRFRTTTWWATLGSCLYTSEDTFVVRNEVRRSAASNFCLADANLWNIRPTLTIPTTPRTKEKRKSELEMSRSNFKRRPTASTTPSPQPTSPILPASDVPTVFQKSSNVDHPYNRFGYKYIPCEPSILPLVGYQQAGNGLGGCTMSTADRSSYVTIKDGLTATTDKGYRMCRANVGVKEGNWYWEANIRRASSSTDSEEAYVRIGWARREACLNGPVGYDAYGYGYRSMTGDKVFCRRPQKYGEPFKAGDVIGLYISLPPRPDKEFKSPTRKRIPYGYKNNLGNLWFEEKDYRPSKEMEVLSDPNHNDEKEAEKNEPYEPRVIPGSSITMYKNGVCQGVMYEDLFDYEDFGRLTEVKMAPHTKKRSKKKKDTSDSGAPRLRQDEFDGSGRSKQWTEYFPLEDDGTLGYYPAVSMYKGGMVTCNFGPEFAFPPDKAEGWKPMSQRYVEYMAEECVWDILDETLRAVRTSNFASQ